MFGLFTAYAVIIVAYFPVACAGYARFGNSVNPDVLLSVQHPAWLIKAANLMVCVHIGAAYQVGLCLKRQAAFGFCILSAF